VSFESLQQLNEVAMECVVWTVRHINGGELNAHSCAKTPRGCSLVIPPLERHAGRQTKPVTSFCAPSTNRAQSMARSATTRSRSPRGDLF
jgi:hypothetical protein